MTTRQRLMFDLLVIFISIFISIGLLKLGVVEMLLALAHGHDLLEAFFAGVFFVSVFTAAPATIVLAELMRGGSPLWIVALLGATGSLIGDYLIFRFYRNTVATDVNFFLEKTGSKKFGIFKSRRLGWLTSFFGALIVASPLPDEIGLAMMGLSKMKTKIFVPLSFILNFIGIFIVGLIARHFF